MFNKYIVMNTYRVQKVEDAGPIFLTIQSLNPTQQDVPLEFNITTTQPILEKPSDFDVSVIRYSIPNYETPLFHFNDTTNYYTMTMNYLTFSATESLIYQPFNGAGAKVIYELQDWATILNNTIDKLFSDLNEVTTLPTTHQPFFTYDPLTEKMSYNADPAYFGTTWNGSTTAPAYTGTITLSVNAPVYQSIRGIMSFSVSSSIFQLLCQDLHYNHVSYTFSGDMSATSIYQMIQESKTMGNISDFNSIILTSNLPCLNEYIGSTNYVSGSSSGGGQVGFPILSDYVPSDLSIDTFFNNIVYNAVVPYRQHRLITDVPFNSIKINAYVTDINGTSTQVLIPPNGGANIKLMFTLRSKSKFS